MKKQIDTNELERVKRERAKIEEEYDVRDGRIMDCGKFEDEMVYLPYYWGIFLNGFADSDNGTVLRFKVSPEERAVFPEIAGRRRAVALWQRDDGFIREV